jgi:hypothetical protein
LADTSFGSSFNKAKKFRAEEKALFDQEKYKEAQQKGIDDVKSRFPGKYEDAIKEMSDNTKDPDVSATGF